LAGLLLACLCQIFGYPESFFFQGVAKTAIPEAESRLFTILAPLKAYYTS